VRVPDLGERVLQPALEERQRIVRELDRQGWLRDARQ
jgi:hypothetical protein